MNRHTSSRRVQHGRATMTPHFIISKYECTVTYRVRGYQREH